MWNRCSWSLLNSGQVTGVECMQLQRTEKQHLKTILIILWYASVYILNLFIAWIQFWKFLDEVHKGILKKKKKVFSEFNASNSFHWRRVTWQPAGQVNREETWNPLRKAWTRERSIQWQGKSIRLGPSWVWDCGKFFQRNYNQRPASHTFTLHVVVN